MAKPTRLFSPPAPDGERGGFIYRGVFALSDNEVGDLQAGRLYVAIASAQYPNGEIRGQIVPEPSTVALLSGGLGYTPCPAAETSCRFDGATLYEYLAKSSQPARVFRGAAVCGGCSQWRGVHDGAPVRRLPESADDLSALCRRRRKAAMDRAHSYPGLFVRGHEKSDGF